ITQNAGSATIQGGNIDLVALVGDAGRFNLFAEYTDATYDKFRYDTAYSIFGSPLFNPASTGCGVGSPFAGPMFGTELVNINCDGFQLPRSPKWAASAGYDHTFTFGDASTLNAAVNMQYASARWLNFDYVKPERVSAYTVFDFDLTYMPAGGHWSVAGYVHNIGNEAVYTGGGEQAFVPPLVYATINAPRTVGIRVRYDIH
ncbi:MAG TPA: TonB-dependent receptor, partial [Rhizomicrobium sp.]